jgi:hypothetical protein
MSDFTEAFLTEIEAALMGYVAVEELQAILSEAVYQAMISSLQGATREEVMAVASEKAALLVTRVSDEMREHIADIIARGLEKQMGVEGTARALRDGLGLDKNRQATLDSFIAEAQKGGLTGQALEDAIAAKRQELINDRARVIASTEMANAMEEGAFVVAKTRGDTHKVWIAGGSPKVCDICIANQAQGVIPIDKAFSSGDMVPPAHPSCYCAVSYLTDTGAGEIERANERAAKRDAAERAKKEAEEAAKQAKQSAKQEAAQEKKDKAAERAIERAEKALERLNRATAALDKANDAKERSKSGRTRVDIDSLVSEAASAQSEADAALAAIKSL